MVVLANGASGISPKPDDFTAQLLDVCQTLAKSIARDGEGASKFIEFVIEGAPSDDAASQRMKAKDIRIRVSLHSGSGNALVWTCDLTEEYIRINADYTT